MQGIRTLSQERIIQDATLEQQTWASILSVHRVRESYAHSVARNVLKHLERLKREKGYKAAHELVTDRAYLLSLMKVLEVSHDHVELAVELIQQCFLVRHEVTRKAVGL